MTANSPRGKADLPETAGAVARRSGGTGASFAAIRRGPWAGAQSRLGNAGLLRLLQARLPVSQPDDPYEQEAERVADALTRTLAPVAGPAAPQRTPDQAPVQIRRACPTCAPEVEPQVGGVATLYRQGDPSRIPAGFACAVGQTTPSGQSAAILFANRGTGLTAAQRGEIAAIADTWRVAGGTTPVRVDGYASRPGSDELNWGLSCARAQAVAAELMHPSSGGPGVPSAQVQVFAHGETEEFGDEADNRRAVIHAPSPPQPTACALPVRLGRARGCASGTDFTHFDFPSISATSAAILAAWAAARVPTRGPLRSVVTDLECEADMVRELALLGGGAGVAAFSRFRAGTGGTERHGPTSTLGAMALASASFAATLAAVKTAIEAQLAAQAAAGTLDACALAVTPPATHFGFGDGTALKAVIGGTQGEELYATAFRSDLATRTYSIDLRFEICDDFGVDEADLYSPALCAFWVLQHERSATLYAPFVNLLALPVTLSGTF